MRTLRASRSFDKADVLDRLDMPTQLIFGSEDQLTPPSIGLDMAEALPNADLAVLAGAGHLSNLEAPNAFNQVLMKFLSAHRDKAAFLPG